ncbi:DUF6879 family protein [Streptomyces gobiensis]|uniref:DUF6879 family protein n=1 Tax=Streptomyces gobiensis TaxID=2875706 RepID=UPI0030D4AFDC
MPTATRWIRGCRRRCGRTGQGKRVEPVRLIDAPPSDFLRFELWGTPHNLSAGEDIRYLQRAEAKPLGLPEYDYWLFDSRIVARLQLISAGLRATQYEPQSGAARRSPPWIGAT